MLSNLYKLGDSQCINRHIKLRIKVPAGRPLI